MGYIDERQRIIQYVTKDGIIIKLTSDRSNEKKYCKELEEFSNGKKLIIRYPGYKTTSGKFQKYVVNSRV